MTTESNPEDNNPRISFRKARWHHYILGKREPRGRTGRAYLFATILKERAPLVYAFVKNELEKDRAARDPRLAPIIQEWRAKRLNPQSQKRLPSRRELAAFIIERAFEGAWEVWGVRPPHSSAQLNSFFRRYIHGHPKAILGFRRALEMAPWEMHHVGYEMKWFLGAPGEAARHYNLLSPGPLDSPLTIPVLRLED